MTLAGVAVAQVISNRDRTHKGRVQLRLPWLPGVEPWARVAALSGGKNMGTYFIPQPGEEVLVAFQHGDVRDVYVLGSLWNGVDAPPADGSSDPVDRRLIVTPAGHQIELHDRDRSVTVTTADGQTVTLTPDKIEVSTSQDTAKLVLETSGAVSLKATTTLKLEAASISLEAPEIEITGSGSAKLGGGAVCEIQAGVVKIN
jgi:uncharacterized protein involved in type VI secretion and phage assembly